MNEKMKAVIRKRLKKKEPPVLRDLPLKQAARSRLDKVMRAR